MPPKKIHEDFVETLGQDSPTYSTVKQWAAAFKRGRESVGNEGWSGRPKDAIADENVKVVHTLVICDRRRDLRSIASEMGISFGTVQLIITNILGMSKVLVRWVPKMLTNDQKRTQLYISRYLLSHYEDDPGNFIERVVTQDEEWVHHFDPESKMQSKQWKYPGSPL